MKTLAVANQKGGTGKSAFVTQFAYYLAAAGLRVLVLDNDHQANTSKALAQSTKPLVSQRTTSQLFLDRYDSIDVAPFVLIAADLGLLKLERQGRVEHNQFAGNFVHFLNAVSPCFDICLIDTNPNPDIRVIASLIGATHVISPIELNQEAVDGITLLLKHEEVGVEKIQRTLNKDLQFVGILPNKVESTPFHKQNFTQLARSGFAKYLIKSDPENSAFAFIPHRSVIAEAQADGCAIWEVKAKDAQGKPTGVIKTAGRDAWRDIKPVFQLIAQRMELAV